MTYANNFIKGFLKMSLSAITRLVIGFRGIQVTLFVSMVSRRVSDCLWRAYIIWSNAMMDFVVAVLAELTNILMKKSFTE